MYVGLPNPNYVSKMEKMVIKNKDTGDKFTVLYNPQSYHQGRSVKYSQKSPIGSDAPLVQFLNGEKETLSFDLFFDSLYAGAEVGGGIVDKAKFGVNSLLPSSANAIDVREYTSKVYNLSKIEKSVHRPPLLTVEWSKLQFKGYMSECKQVFTKFNEQGKAVRATLTCTFTQYVEYEDMFGSDPQESPDTTKYRRVKEGDSLWALASMEYGDGGKWRVIAGANGLANPRLLHTGAMIRIPALKD